MGNNFSYPRVTLSTYAKKHSNNVVNVPDTTILFAPLVTEKGPTDRLVKVHTLSEFIDIFGSFNEEFYNVNGQMALNIYNWLNNGGTLLTKRLKPEGIPTAHNKESSYKVKLTPAENFSVIVEDDFKYDYNLKSFVGGIKSVKKGGNTHKGIIRKINNKVYILANDLLTVPADPEDEKSTTKEGASGLFRVDDSNIAAELNFELIEAEVKAKYPGKYYEGITIEFQKINQNYFNINISKQENGKSVTLERFIQKTLKNYKAALSASQYISSDISVESELSNYLEGTSERALSYTLIIPDEDSYTESYTLTQETLRTFYSSTDFTDDSVDGVGKYLSNHLESTIDVVLDAGYDDEVKKALLGCFSNGNDESLRPDVILILDTWALNENLRLNTPEYNYNGDLDSNVKVGKPTNVALYEQFFTVSDATFSGQDIYVTPTYFLSSLLPYNDLTYGVQYPVAGLRRAVLEEAINVNVNPDKYTKDDWFKRRINYAERTSREIAFMSQRVCDGSDEIDYTALSFLNNSRVLEKIKKEIEAMARDYLHEFNDAVTLSNMSSALNKYIANWIANRTLSMGIVTVSQDEVSENAIDIDLNIRFTNTIEVINVSIVIE